MNIVIVGGGNIGTQFAVHCAEKKHKVTFFCSQPDLFQKELSILDENGKETNKASIDCFTNSPEVAFSKADLIFVTVPAFLMKKIATEIEPYYRKDLIIGLIPGIGGGEIAFKNAIDKGVIIFGLQRVPSVARIKEYGKSVTAVGYRSTLHVAAIPNKATNQCAEILKTIFSGQTVETLPNYLCVTMTPSNPILHTTRLRTIFSDYTDGKKYDSIPLFYEEWSDESSELLLKCDEEVQNICKNLTDFDLRNVKSLKSHYESDTMEQLTCKIRSIKSLHGLKTPAVFVENGLIPDFKSRYFSADFPFGLEILVQIGKMFELSIPNLEETLNWFYGIQKVTDKFSYKDNGITDSKEFISFYSH